MNGITEHQDTATVLADNFISVSWELTRSPFCKVKPNFPEEENDILTPDEGDPNPVIDSFWKVEFSSANLQNATQYYKSTLHG